MNLNQYYQQLIEKRILSTNFFLPFVKGKRFIFVYHDVCNPGESQFSAEHYSTTIDNFRNQIRFLKSKFELIPLQELVSDEPLNKGKNYASIVFDDGFYSILRHAQGILNKEQVPFSVFINKSAVEHNQLWVSNLIMFGSDYAYMRRIYDATVSKSVSFDVFENDPINCIKDDIQFSQSFKDVYLRNDATEKIYLDEADVRKLHNDGVLIGSHSADHYQLAACSGEEQEFQVSENKRFLEELIQETVNHFAIPFGKKNHYNKAALEKIAAHHRYAYSTNVVPFTMEEVARKEFLIPRIGILNQSPDEIMFYVNRTFIKEYHL